MTAGSYALLDAKPSADSTMAAKLREAGMIIMGKTGLSQWANYRSSNSSNGWSAYGGQVTAAFVPNQDPSGSSSGSGVSSDMGLAFACLGTEVRRNQPTITLLTHMWYLDQWQYHQSQ